MNFSLNSVATSLTRDAISAWTSASTGISASQEKNCLEYRDCRSSSCRQTSERKASPGSEPVNDSMIEETVTFESCCSPAANSNSIQSATDWGDSGSGRSNILILDALQEPTYSFVALLNFINHIGCFVTMSDTQSFLQLGIGSPEQFLQHSLLTICEVVCLNQVPRLPEILNGTLTCHD